MSDMTGVLLIRSSFSSQAINPPEAGGETTVFRGSTPRPDWEEFDTSLQFFDQASQDQLPGLVSKSAVA